MASIAERINHRELALRAIPSPASGTFENTEVDPKRINWNLLTQPVRKRRRTIPVVKPSIENI
jgi:hypothetical protein